MSKKRITDTRSAEPDETAPAATVDVSQPRSVQPLVLQDESDNTLVPHAPAAKSSAEQLDLTAVAADNDQASVVDIPCCLCRIPLTADTRRCCVLNSRLRPFCAMNASCSRSVLVDELLVYCSMQCARRDGRQLLSRPPRLLSDSLSHPAPSLVATAATRSPPSHGVASPTPATPACFLSRTTSRRGATPVSNTSTREPRASRGARERDGAEAEQQQWTA